MIVRSVQEWNQSKYPTIFLAYFVHIALIAGIHCLQLPVLSEYWHIQYQIMKKVLKIHTIYLLYGELVWKKLTE